MTKPAIEDTGDGVVIRVRVQPKASRDALIVESDGRIRIALTAPPVDGAANDALIRFVAKFLKVRRRLVAIRSGEQSREKTLFIAETQPSYVLERLGGGTS